MGDLTWLVVDFVESDEKCDRNTLGEFKKRGVGGYLNTCACITHDL